MHFDFTINKSLQITPSDEKNKIEHKEESMKTTTRE